MDGQTYENKKKEVYQGILNFDLEGNIQVQYVPFVILHFRGADQVVFHRK